MDKNTRKEPTSIFPMAVVHNVMLQKENPALTTISAHTFLLVMLHYGKQDKKQHGKSIRHSKRYLVGVCRVTGEVNVKPNARRSGKAKSNMSQLTQSLDYRWNEREWGWYKM